MPAYSPRSGLPRRPRCLPICCRNDPGICFSPTDSKHPLPLTRGNRCHFGHHRRGKDTVAKSHGSQSAPLHGYPETVVAELAHIAHLMAQGWMISAEIHKRSLLTIEQGETGVASHPNVAHGVFINTRDVGTGQRILSLRIRHEVTRRHMSHVDHRQSMMLMGHIKESVSPSVIVHTEASGIPFTVEALKWVNFPVLGSRWSMPLQKVDTHMPPPAAGAT